MRVNIGYGCDLEDVQEEISSFLERVSLKLNEAAANVGKTSTAMVLENYDPQEVLLAIHKVRLSMAKIDLRLEDASTIIVGLENAKAKIAAGEDLEMMPEEPEAAAPLQVVEPEEESSRVKGPKTKKAKRGRKKKGSN